MQIAYGEIVKSCIVLYIFFGNNFFLCSLSRKSRFAEQVTGNILNNEKLVLLFNTNNIMK